MIGPVTISVLVALFVWWISTGLILIGIRVADRVGGGMHGRLTLWCAPLIPLGLWGLHWSAQHEQLLAVYVAFFSALAIWAWIELAFLSGVITGPNQFDLPNGTPEWERFLRAWGTVAYHEILLVVMFVSLFAHSIGQVNTVGFWTFAILYFARISAKLNLYLGVPRINLEFIPPHLHHLKSHFRKADLNWLFPISVTCLTFAVACWIERIIASQMLADKVGFGLLAALSALALLEHWLMVIPLPDAKLWRWMLPAPSTLRKDYKSEDAHGL